MHWSVQKRILNRRGIIMNQIEIKPDPELHDYIEKGFLKTWHIILITVILFSLWVKFVMI